VTAIVFTSDTQSAQLSNSTDRYMPLL